MPKGDGLVEEEPKALPAARAEADVAVGEQPQVLIGRHVVDDQLDPRVLLGGSLQVVHPALELRLEDQPQVVALGGAEGLDDLLVRLARSKQSPGEVET